MTSPGPLAAPRAPAVADPQTPVGRLGILQFAPQKRSVGDNVAYICRTAGKLHDAIVLLPEFFLSSYRSDPLFFFEEDELADSLAPLCRLSREQRIRFFGSLPVTTTHVEQNRGVAIVDGALSFPYDKRRLFGMEHSRFTPGSTTYNLVAAGNLTCTLQICFDLVDPAPTREAARAGADVVLNPACVSVDYLRTIGRARALENQVVVVFANRCGEDPDGTRYLGRSVVFLPDGTEAVAAGDRQGLLTFSLDGLDLDAVKQRRRTILEEHSA